MGDGKTAVELLAYQLRLKRNKMKTDEKQPYHLITLVRPVRDLS